MRLGHEVHLLCQEYGPRQLGFVDAVGDWESGRLERQARAPPAHAGRCTVYRPDIERPAARSTCTTRYEDFEVRPSTTSPTRSSTATSTRTSRPCGTWSSWSSRTPAFANHLVMGPVILARALDDMPYAVKIHGSDLEYTVKPHYQRFAPYASEGLVPAQGGARRLAAHGGEPVGGDAARRPARAHVPGPARASTFTPSCRASRTTPPMSYDGLVRWLESAERTGFNAAAEEAIDAPLRPAAR